VEYLDDRDINIYTDGSSYSAPRRGGIGIRYVTVDEHGHEHSDDYPLPGYSGVTNQQMELAACIEALRAVVTRRAPIRSREYRRIVIWTDSTYLVTGYDSARFNWQADRWRTRDGNPVANAAQWKELLKIAARTGLRVEMKWVKGHRNSQHNKAVDKLAKRSAQQRTGRHLSIVKVRRKVSEKAVERGSVQMLGQRATIRIITDEFLPVQRVNKYKYEIVSRSSYFHGCVDIIYSNAEIQLSAGHTYHVRFNEETARPRVLKMFREIDPPSPAAPSAS
jgi:ribonuclease HI